MAFLGAVLGLRWGECAGLNVGRIDFERQTISVAQQVTRGVGGRSVLGPRKSAAGRPTLAAPTPLMELMKDRFERQGRIADVDAFVFTSSSGEHLDYSNWLHRIWYPARERAGLDWLQFHDLRRANATGLVLEDVDIKTAQACLGHTDPRLTLAIYAEATTEADRTADLIGKRFLPTRGQTPAEGSPDPRWTRDGIRPNTKGRPCGRP